MGKSCAASDLIERTKGRWDLVIAFVGSASCNPVLEKQMKDNGWDSRFFFAHYDEELMARLLEQQTRLRAEGRERNVLVIVDDVVLQGRSSDSLANLAIRGRHFNVSIIMACVSYTTIPKRMRRSLDALLVFSCPMNGDMQILTWEFTSRVKMARFALSNLKQHQCLVLETLEKSQTLYVWRARLLELVTPGSGTCHDSQTTPRSSRDEPQTGSEPEKLRGGLEDAPQKGTLCDQGRTLSEDDEASLPSRRSVGGPYGV